MVKTQCFILNFDQHSCVSSIKHLSSFTMQVWYTQRDTERVKHTERDRERERDRQKKKERINKPTASRNTFVVAKYSINN